MENDGKTMHVIIDHPIINSKEDLVKQAMIRYNVKYSNEIETSVGHLLSIINEYSHNTNPDLGHILNDLNECISFGGDGFQKVSSVDDVLSHGDKRHYGFTRYISLLFSRKIINQDQTIILFDRISEELRGISYEDKYFPI